MSTLTKCSIAHKALSVGTHRFDFKIGDRFFEAFEGSEIHRGKADVQVVLNKQSNLLTLDFRLEGEVCVTCDRCIEEFMMPVGYTGTLAVRYSETEQESDGEVMWIGPSETEIDLSQYIYESICLSLPYQRVHPVGSDGKSGCDPDMLARFNIVSEEEFDRLTGNEQTETLQDKLKTKKSTNEK